jgi:hypothetical protein
MDDGGVPDEALTCRRCQQPVLRFAKDYETFERMHWSCFHYEFEHELEGSSPDPDIACRNPGCPARAFDEGAVPDWYAEG